MALETGIKPGVDLSVLTVNESAIVKAFSKSFLVSYVRKDFYKQIQNGFAIINPGPEIRNRFGLTQELVAILHPLDIFEKRSLDFLESLLAEFKNRVHSTFYVVVSEDQQIVQKVKNINASENLNFIGVPFSTRELNGIEISKVIDARFAEFLFGRDFFAENAPIRSEEFFFGRQQIIQKYLQKYEDVAVATLFGLRKIGKTSVLFALQRAAKQRGIPCVYVDCQNPDLHSKTWQGLLQTIIELACDQLQVSKDDIFNGGNRPPTEAVAEFKQALLNLKRRHNGRPVYLLIDEVESISVHSSTAEHWKSGKDFISFWQAIRSLIQDDPSLLRIVITGVNPRILELSEVDGVDNPIYILATAEYLPLFSFEEIQSMVACLGKYMGLSFEDRVVYGLFEDFGGHPFLSRMACSQINSLYKSIRPSEVTRFWYKTNRPKFTSEVLQYVGQVLHVLKQHYENEFQMLEALAGKDARLFAQFRSSSPWAMKHLMGYGLVHCEDDDCSFTLQIVEDYLNHTAQLKRPFETDEEKWTEVNKRRNKVEARLRQVAATVLVAQYGNEAKDKMLQIIPEERRKKIPHNSLNIREIFENHFFFQDLLQLIAREFKYFERIFSGRRDYFVQCMEHINRERVDAHARPIDEPTMSQLLTEFGWLDKCLDSIYQ